MDGPWHQNYRPTAHPADGPFIPPLKILEAIPQVTILANKLKEQPYNPETWLARSWMLKLLGFPELALGDAHKARLLFERADQASLGRSDEQQQLLAVRVWAQIQDALGETNARTDQRAVYAEGQEHAKRVRTAGWKVDQKSAFFLDMLESPLYLADIETKVEAMDRKINAVIHSKEEREAARRIGHVHVRNYPWMAPSQATRSDALRQQVATEIEQRTNGYATIITSPIASKDGKPQPNVWGVHAVKPIPKKHLLMSDSAPISASDRILSLENGITLRCAQCQLPINLRKVVKLDCKPCKFCSQSCGDTAKSSWHAIICPPTSTDLEKEVHAGIPARPAVRLELFLRYLATVVHKCGITPTITSASTPASSQLPPTKDPLQHPLTARLTPNTIGPQTHSFTYFEHIILPLRTLEALGINIFTDFRFDTWVLQTLRRRIDNNNTGKEVHGVWPRMAMCNHSCEPNVAYSPDEEGSAVLCLKARRRIEAGEEVCVSYIEDEDDDVVGGRRYRLLHWLGCECQCGRCLREEAAAAKESEQRGD